VKIREYPKPKFFEKMMAKVFSSVVPGEFSLSPVSSVMQNTEAKRLMGDLNYRFSRNGQIMPMLPLMFM